MTFDPSFPPEEQPRKRFRRLLQEAEEETQREEEAAEPGLEPGGERLPPGAAAFDMIEESPVPVAGESEAPIEPAGDGQTVPLHASSVQSPEESLSQVKDLPQPVPPQPGAELQDESASYTVEPPEESDSPRPLAELPEESDSPRPLAELPEEGDSTRLLAELPEEGDSPRPLAVFIPDPSHSTLPPNDSEQSGSWLNENDSAVQPSKSNYEDTQPVRLRPSSPSHRSLGDTPIPPGGKPRPLPDIDEHGFPLPRRVNEIDVEATRVTPAAYSNGQRSSAATRASSAARPGATRPGITRPGPSSPPGRRVPPGAPPPPPAYYPPAPQRARPAPRRRLSFGLGCLLRMALTSLFALAVVALCGISIMLLQYYRIASTLPDINDLRQRASQFETTRILDRNGNTLYEILDPSAGRRTYMPLEKISPYLVAATIATEDKAFYSHPGFDVTAIFRAFLQNQQSGETVSGASTITQQLARNLLFTPDERTDRSYQRKIREAILAAEITRRYSKDEILELYLNENYYGNLAYGAEAGAETYFGTTAMNLTLGQAAFLAGLPQAPAVYDVYTNREQTLRRQQDVLVLMYEASQEQGCIYVSNNPQRICLDPVSVTQAATELQSYQFRSPEIEIRYPHWVNYVRSLLEAQFDSQTIYRSGFTVYTTLDPAMQDLAERLVKEQVNALADRHVTDGALVAMRPNNGEILAMVGSADFYNEAISGEVNMAVSPRQPGSSIKPLTYVAAFEKGWTPGTLIWDVPSEFPPSGRPDDLREPYEPVNYDGRFHGPVTLRYALANSYNIPAVKTLNFVGIYDDPNVAGEDGFLAFARRLGITTLTRPDYGLSLTLGGGDVSLLELTGAYAIFANSGRRVPPVAITRILDHAGNVVFQYQQPTGEQVVRPEHAFLISSILSDNEARTPAFGRNSVLALPFQAAAKTGTTNDFRDNWTLGYTPELAVGVWVGNADYTPMQNTSGLTGAAPIWSAFMQEAVPKVANGNPTPFQRPGGVVEYVICSVSGTRPSEWCPEQRTEVFAADQPPLPKEQDLWQKALVDTWTGLRASNACRDFAEERFVLNVTDESARRWIRRDEEGQAWADEMGLDEDITFAPERECKADDPRPELGFISPRDGERITENPLEIRAVADATEWFDYFRLEWGEGDDPDEWETLDEWNDPVREPEDIYEWDLAEIIGEELDPGIITLRLWMHSTQDTHAEKTIRLNIQVPTPTPTPTQTPTPTPPATETPRPTDTQVPSKTPPPTETQPAPITEVPPPSGLATPTPSGTPPSTGLNGLLATVISIFP